MTLEAVYKNYATHQQGSWIMRPDNARALFYFIKDNDIKSVLDLGGGIGCSAAVCAYALKEKGVDYTVDSLEQFEKCVLIAKEILPNELKVDFQHVPAVVWSHPDVPYMNLLNFEKIPDKQYDLIITDGPGPALIDDKLVELDNGDVLKLLFENKIKQKSFIVFDGRKQSVDLLERFYADNFFHIPSNVNRFKILQRKENDVSFIDARREFFEQTGYFKHGKENTNN